jgi:hypothetical protein
MEAIAHSPSFAKKVGVPQSVGKDFSNADKGRKFSKGGDMATKKMAKGGSTIGTTGVNERRGMTTAKMGKVKTGAPSRDGIAERGKTRGKNLGDSGKTVGIMSGAKGMKRGGKAC